MWTGMRTISPLRRKLLKKLIPRVHPGAVVLLHHLGHNASILDELLTQWEDLDIPLAGWKKSTCNSFKEIKSSPSPVK